MRPGRESWLSCAASPLREISRRRWRERGDAENERQRVREGDVRDGHLGDSSQRLDSRGD